MKRPKTGSTPKQWAYATNRLGGKGRSKKEIALLSGFSPAMAENAKYKIEETEGYHNAMFALATESGNLVLAALSEYKRRGLTDFTNNELNGMLNAVTSAWERIEKKRNPDKLKTEEGNPLRKVVMNRIENQTVINNPAVPASATPTKIKDAETADPMDF